MSRLDCNCQLLQLVDATLGKQRGVCIEIALCVRFRRLAGDLAGLGQISLGQDLIAGQFKRLNHNRVLIQFDFPSLLTGER